MIELNRIHNITALELFAGLPEQAALIVADPPYGISYKSNEKRRIGSERKGVKLFAPREELENFPDSIIDTSWLASAHNALKDGGAMYLFTRWDVLHYWHAAAAQAGFNVAQCLVWDKTHWGAGDLDYYGSQTENILFCVKGRHALRWQHRGGNVWRVARGAMLSRDGGGRHPTQKPVDLFRKIITYSSDVNDLVVDPFTGSGAACVAAQRLHRRFIGCDISPTFATAAQSWIEKTAPHSLPMF